MEIPCGGCIGCRLDRAAEWQTRLYHESMQHNLKAFITCTYAPEHLPENGTLVKKHFQDFLKRLRNTVRPIKIRFFACGEYGEKLTRPHYHAIIFGYDFTDKKHYKTHRGNKLYTSETLTKLWGMGHCITGAVTPDSCGYVSRYIMKKVRGQKAETHYHVGVNTQTGEMISVLPEYIHMSLKPGIGASYYEQNKRQLHAQDSVVVKGKLRKVPKYYDRQTEKEDPELLEWLKHIRAEQAKTRSGDNTPRRLEDREYILTQKSLNVRNLS